MGHFIVQNLKILISAHTCDVLKHGAFGKKGMLSSCKRLFD